MKWERDTIAPAARRSDLVVERMAEEILVYDLESDEAHGLSATAAAVFDLCDGRATIGQIAAAASERLDEPVSPDAVGDAMDQLGERELLAERPGVSRREAMRKAAMVGAGAAASVPLIKSIAAPDPAQAQTTPCFPQGAGCADDNQCCSFNCNSGTCGPPL